MTKKIRRTKHRQPSPAKIALALKCIMQPYLKAGLIDEKLLLEILDVTQDIAIGELLPAKKAAQQLGCAEKTIANKRVTGSTDLPHVKIGSRVYYKQSDIAAFIDKNIRLSTSDVGGAK